MKIRETLQRRNHDVKEDLEQIVALVSRSPIPFELEPYRNAFLARTQQLLNTCRENLALLSTGEDSLLADVLSETSTLVQYARLLKFRYLRGLYRATDWDRVCLRTITWLHREHEQTKDYPAVFADDDVSVVPSKGLPFYFFPCVEQRGLRFQPLLFHEFGHLLYKCHELELDALVGDFQQFVESGLLPVSQRNDQYAQEQARIRQSIVETWYKWIQEFFCDAVGFEIGGPCFLYAFSEYIAKFQSADYSRQAPDLHGSSHPVSWLRIKLLIGRAQSKGFETQASWVSERWNDTATLLNVGEDHHGFYLSSLNARLTQTLDDMLVEVGPRQFTNEEAAGLGWNTTSPNLVSLLNYVWIRYFSEASTFGGWESNVLRQHYNLTPSSRT
jgi:hypothetical protein